MATGVGGMSFLSNLPQENFEIAPALFNELTERQDIPAAGVPFNGLGTTTSLKIINVGVASLMKIWFVGTMHTGAGGTITALPGIPYSLANRVSFNANGQTSIIAARATTLRARRQRVFRNPEESLEATIAPGTLTNSTAYAIAFMIDVPISHDMFTGIGWVLAQNPSTYLSVEINWASLTQAFAITGEGKIESFTGTVYSELTTFAVGQGQVGNTMKTILPDLTAFHGLLDNTYSFSASGIVQAPLIRTAGQLLSYAFNLSNGPAQIAPESLTELQFRYGGNRQPRAYNPIQFLLDKNQQDYNGLLVIKGLNYTYLDFEVDNPTRDLFIPEALVELQAQITIPSTVTVVAGAYVLYVEETLYPAV